MRRTPQADARLVKVASFSGSGACLLGPHGEVVVEDDGYVELRYWPPDGQQPDPGKIADLIADVLSRDIAGGSGGRAAGADLRAG